MMHLATQELLAHTGLAQHQDRDVQLGHPVDHGQRTPESSALADHARVRTREPVRIQRQQDHQGPPHRQDIASLELGMVYLACVHNGAVPTLEVLYDHSVCARELQLAVPP